MKKVSVVILVLSFYHISEAQQQNNTVNAKNIKEVNFYNSNIRNYILNLNKYIDTTKIINVNIGGESAFSIHTTFGELKKHEISTDQMMLFEGYSVLGGLKVKVELGKLKISCQIFAFDGKYIAGLVENKLTPSKQTDVLYATDKYLEIFDDHHIPVLQIDLDRKTNTINIAGVFNTDKSYAIASKERLIIGTLPKKLNMPQQWRDSTYQQYLETVRRLIKPIHE